MAKLVKNAIKVRSLDTWADGWCTTFNASKSAHMFISSKHRRSGDTSRLSLSLSGGIIPLVRTTAHLGVRTSSTLSWSDHVSNIIRRVKFKAFLLKRLARRHGSADLVKQLYCCQGRSWSGSHGWFVKDFWKVRCMLCTAVREAPLRPAGGLGGRCKPPKRGSGRRPENF